MSMPFSVAPEQVMKDRADDARKVDLTTIDDPHADTRTEEGLAR